MRAQGPKNLRRQEKTNKAVRVVRPWHIYIYIYIHQAGHETSYKYSGVQMDFFLLPFSSAKRLTILWPL